MLKACWDCIGGSTNTFADQNGAYGAVHLNGDTQRVPTWPNSNMGANTFLLPRWIEPGYQITVSGRMSSDRRSITVSLVCGDNYPDDDNIACELIATFDNDNDKVELRTIENGVVEPMPGDYQELSATEYMSGVGFNVKFVVVEDGVLDVYIFASSLTSVRLRHRLGQIRFLKLSGDIEKVEQLAFAFP